LHSTIDLKRPRSRSIREEEDVGGLGRVVVGKGDLWEADWIVMLLLRRRRRRRRSVGERKRRVGCGDLDGIY
jgi:hypothetical protein